MRSILVIIILTFFLTSEAKECDVLTLEQEIHLTQNIALVTVGGFFNDSIELRVVKKWKGDSILDRNKLDSVRPILEVPVGNEVKESQKDSL